MSALVAQHQQASFPGPTNGSAGDATVVLGNDNATVTTYNAHDADPTIHVQSSSAATFAATPAATAGRKWMTNDTGAVYLYYDTGSAWVEVNYLRNNTATFTDKLISTTAIATPSALVATTFGAFASTVSGAVIMGFGTTNDVSLKNRAGTTVLGIGPNTTTVNLAGALTYGGVTLAAAVTGTGNMVLSAAPTFSGTVTSGGRIISAGGYSTDATKTAALLHIYGNVASTVVIGRFEGSDRRIDIFSDEIRTVSSYLSFNSNGVNGIAVGAPTGGDKGGGTANFAGDIYKNNSAYTNPHYAFEHWATGKIVKYADREGASTYKGRMSLADLEAYVREHHHFPRITNDPMGMFQRGDVMLELVEEAFTHLIDQRRETAAEITALRQEVAALKTVSG